MSINYKYSFPLDELMSESLVDLQQIASPLSIMPVQAAWKTIGKASSIASTNQESPFQLSEIDFPFLDAKPQVDDFKKVKGRRNASEQLLQKKLAGQAYVLKQVVGQGKGIGKKRRARLLSNEDSEMKLNVPYSLNRKNRWEVESSAEYLKDRRSDKHVQLCALDQHLTVKGLSPSKDVLAFHQVDQHGTLNSRKSQSQRGSTLSALSVECEEKPLSIRYVLAKSNPNAKGLIGGSLDKAKPLPRNKKRAQLDVSIYSTDNETNDEEGGLFSPGSVSEEVNKMYAPPPRTTFNLADFVREKRGPVIVKPPRSSGRISLETYVQVEMPDVQEDVDHQNMPASPMSKLGQTKSLFKTLYVQAESIGIGLHSDWLRNCNALSERAELRFQWLNNALRSFQIDVTSLIMTSTKQPHLVLSVAQEPQMRIRILLNGSQECKANLEAIEAAFAGVNGLDGLIEAVVKNVEISQDQNRNVKATVCSTELSTTITVIDNYSLLYAPKTGCCAATVPSIVEEDEEDGCDDFEHIDMTDFIDSDQVLDTKWRDSAFDSEVDQMKTFCNECGEHDTSKIVLIDDCSHSFCTRCLKACLYQQICENSPFLCCSFKECSAPIPMYILQSIFELPIVCLALRSCAEAKAKEAKNKLFVCPSGCGLVAVESTSVKLGHVNCNSCKRHFCVECYGSPHFPLSCQQYVVWTQKCDLQSQRPTVDQQYWSICSEASKRRTEVSKNVKEALKRAGYKQERQFMDMRTAVLQMVENGYAYLYLTRNDRPQNWQTVKSNLNFMYKEMNIFENSLLNNAQSADKISDNIQKVRVTIRKMINELHPKTQ